MSYRARSARILSLDCHAAARLAMTGAVGWRMVFRPFRRKAALARGGFGLNRRSLLRASA
jgi:hypothetical protein